MHTYIGRRLKNKSVCALITQCVCDHRSDHSCVDHALPSGSLGSSAGTASSLSDTAAAHNQSPGCVPAAETVPSTVLKWFSLYLTGRTSTVTAGDDSITSRVTFLCCSTKFTALTWTLSYLFIYFKSKIPRKDQMCGSFRQGLGGHYCALTVVGETGDTAVCVDGGWAAVPRKNTGSFIIVCVC